MTFQEATSRLGLGVFDYAIPQGWVDMQVGRLEGSGFTYRDICNNFVWCYDSPNTVFGRPCAVTFKGNEILLEINKAMGMPPGEGYPLTDFPADWPEYPGKDYEGEG